MKNYLTMIKKLYETSDIEMANEKLKDGWLFIDIYTKKTQTFYILGKN